MLGVLRVCCLEPLSQGHNGLGIDRAFLFFRKDTQGGQEINRDSPGDFCLRLFCFHINSFLQLRHNNAIIMPYNNSQCKMEPSMPDQQLLDALQPHQSRMDWITLRTWQHCQGIVERGGELNDGQRRWLQRFLDSI